MSLSAAFGEPPTRFGQKSPRKRVLKSAYTRSGRKVNCYQSGRRRFWPSCDISATNNGSPIGSWRVSPASQKIMLCQFVGRIHPRSRSASADGPGVEERPGPKGARCPIAAQQTGILRAVRFSLPRQSVARPLWIEIVRSRAPHPWHLCRLSDSEGPGAAA